MGRVTRACRHRCHISIAVRCWSCLLKKSDSGHLAVIHHSSPLRDNRLQPTAWIRIVHGVATILLPNIGTINKYLMVDLIKQI